MYVQRQGRLKKWHMGVLKGIEEHLNIAVLPNIMGMIAGAA